MKIGDLIETEVLGKKTLSFVIDVSRTGICILWQGSRLWKCKENCRKLKNSRGEI